jgi:hypothetical protein
MRKAKTIIGALGVLAVAFILGGQTAFAQSTLFNIPSTDVAARGKVYVEFDYLSHLADHTNGGFTTLAGRTVIGVGRNVEVGVNVPVTDVGSLRPVEIQPNLKWQFVNEEKSGIAASAGGLLYVPVNDKSALTATGVKDTFGLLYTVVSKKIKAKYGPRFTVGGYGLAGRQNGNGSEGGAIVGYEQPLHEKVSFVTDWFSGKNRFGYVTPGLAFSLPKNSAIYAGYSIGNQGRKNNALYIYFGITF